MRLLYASVARLPTEKAHGYQIMQMCEAFAEAGAQLTLLYRRNDDGLYDADPWTHYGIPRCFEAEALRTINLFPWAGKMPRWLLKPYSALANALLLPGMALSIAARVRREPEALIYTRDPLTAFWLAWRFPRRARRVFFEAHTYPTSRGGLLLRRWLARHIGGVVTMTAALGEREKSLGLPAERQLAAHDGFRPGRFEIGGDRAEWRGRFGWTREAFIVGYVGRFYTMGMDKGLGLLAEAVALLNRDDAARPTVLALVGGPAETVEALRPLLPADRLNYAGQVGPEAVPGYLRAFDVGTMPFPWTEHFAYYASALKLFEYMAAGTPVVASDLPATAEVIRDGQNGLLYPVGEVEGLAGVLRRLRDDPTLAQRLAAQAAEDVQAYSWPARAQLILAWMAGLVSA